VAAKKGLNKGMKIVALIVILAMVVGGIALSLFAALGGGANVAGTYKSSDGRKLVLAKNGAVTLTVSGQPPATAKYTVKGDQVIIQVDAKNQVAFNIDGKDLVVENSSGGQDRWVRQ
jgi:hypothetical protein